MIALLLAAGVLAAPNNFVVRPETACPGQRAVQASAADPASLLRPQDRAAVKFSRLGDLPKANMEVAVMRTLSGCMVPVAVKFEVEGDGRFATGADRQ